MRLKCTANARVDIMTNNSIEIEESLQSADIFNKLRMRRDQVPIRPLMEGKLE